MGISNELEMTRNQITSWRSARRATLYNILADAECRSENDFVARWKDTFDNDHELLEVFLKMCIKIVVPFNAQGTITQRVLPAAMQPETLEQEAAGYEDVPATIEDFANFNAYMNSPRLHKIAPEYVGIDYARGNSDSEEPAEDDESESILIDLLHAILTNNRRAKARLHPIHLDDELQAGYDLLRSGDSKRWAGYAKEYFQSIIDNLDTDDPDIQHAAFRQHMTDVWEIIPLPCRPTKTLADFIELKDKLPTTDRFQLRSNAPHPYIAETNNAPEITPTEINQTPPLTENETNETV